MQRCKCETLTEGTCFLDMIRYIRVDSCLKLCLCLNEVCTLKCVLSCFLVKILIVLPNKKSLQKNIFYHPKSYDHCTRTIIILLLDKKKVKQLRR